VCATRTFVSSKYTPGQQIRRRKEAATNRKREKTQGENLFERVRGIVRRVTGRGVNAESVKMGNG